LSIEGKEEMHRWPFVLAAKAPEDKLLSGTCALLFGARPIPVAKLDMDRPVKQLLR
jgi:hypothetical protein